MPRAILMIALLLIPSGRDQLLWRMPGLKRRASRLERFFLNERIIPILEERLATAR